MLKKKMKRHSGTLICALLAASGISLEQSHLPDQISFRPEVQVRATYPYSLISGGIRNSDEFEAARANDPVLEAHYATVGALHPVVLPIDRWDYASYRMGGTIYWTSHRVRIAAHELLFADDAGHEVRGRCGNRLSDTPRQPVAFVEPPELDRPRVEITMIPELPPEFLPPALPPTDVLVEMPPAPPLVTPPLTASRAVLPPTETPVSVTGTSAPRPILTTPPGIVTIPEPGTVWLLVGAACGVTYLRRSFKRS